MALLFLSVFLLLGDVGLFVNVFISLSSLNVGFFIGFFFFPESQDRAIMASGACCS